MMKAIQRWFSSGMWMQFLLAALFASIIVQVWRLSEERTPSATEMDEAFAPIALSVDGKVITLRKIASEDMRVCVELRTGGGDRCYMVGQLRSGLAVRVAGDGR